MMCHGGMDMSKSMKWVLVLKILHSERPVLHSGPHTPPPNPEHIVYAKNSIKSWGLRWIGHVLYPQGADSSCWEAMNRCPSYRVSDTQ